jgi:hypothetical protein
VIQGLHAGKETTGPLAQCLALYQGTTSVVPSSAQNGPGFSSCQLVTEPKKRTGAKARLFLRLYGTTKVVP